MKKQLLKVLGISSMMMGIIGTSVFASSSGDAIKEGGKFGKWHHNKQELIENLDTEAMTEEEIADLKEKYALKWEQRRERCYKNESGEEAEQSENVGRKHNKRGFKQEELEEIEKESLTEEEIAERKQKRPMKKENLAVEDAGEESEAIKKRGGHGFSKEGKRNASKEE